MDEEIKNLLQATLSVLIENRDEDKKKTRKDEVLLSDSGLKPHEIAKILGKSQAATTKAIQRAKRDKK